MKALRRNANNKALAIIENSAVNSTITEQDAAKLAYLTKIVEILSGEPDLGSYMLSDSDLPISLIPDVSLAYEVNNSSSSSLVLKNDDGISVEIKMPDYININDIVIQEGMTEEQKYSALQKLTEDAINNGVDLYAPAALVNAAIKTDKEDEKIYKQNYNKCNKNCKTILWNPKSTK